MRFRLSYFLLCLRRLPASFFWSPRYVTRLLLARLAFSITRRFCGPAFHAPNGDPVFNVQSLVNAFGMHAVRELDGPWMNYLRETPAPLVLDVGSNIGQFRRMVVDLNPGARVITFDPWREMAAYVPTCGFTHYPVALGWKDHSAGLLHKAPFGWTGSTEDGVYGKPNTYDQRTEVRTLDSIWEELGKPQVAVLKIDVDGAEQDVLNGAWRMLPFVKFVIVETMHPKVIAMLAPGRRWSTVNGYDFTGEVLYEGNLPLATLGVGDRARLKGIRDPKLEHAAPGTAGHPRGPEQEPGVPAVFRRTTDEG